MTFSKNKYGNRKVTIDGHTFDSKKEANYYLYLMELERRGEIRDLRLQVPYEIIPAIYETRIKHLKTKDKEERKLVQKAVHYMADFVFTVVSSGKEEVVDTKGFRTEAYKLKKKMMRAFLGIEIQEI